MNRNLIQLAIVAVMLSVMGCASFSNRVHKSEMTAVAVADRAMTAFGIYFDTAIKDPAGNNTTAEKLWDQRAKVNAASLAFTLGVSKLDKLRLDYIEKLATKEQVNEAEAEVIQTQTELVKMINEAIPPTL